MVIKEKVYKQVSKIPAGKVMTYGQIAKILGLKSPRIVGRVLHQNTDPENIPCHRVVFADGSLSHAYAFGGEQAQKARLQEEGVVFNKDKVAIVTDLTRIEQDC